MSTRLAARPVDPNTAAHLEVVADTQTPLGALRTADFRAACDTDGRAHDGWVSVNRVSELLHDRFGEINPRWFSAQWGPACAPAGFLDAYSDTDLRIDPKRSRGNGNKSTIWRRLRGWPSPAGSPA